MTFFSLRTSVPNYFEKCPYRSYGPEKTKRTDTRAHRHKHTCIHPYAHATSMKISNGTSTHSPFPQRPILDSSKPKEFADEKFVFDEDGRQVSKWVENTMGKGEIARHEQFLHFPQCFQNTYTRKNQRLFGKGLRRTIVQKKKKSV